MDGIENNGTVDPVGLQVWLFPDTQVNAI